MRWVMSGRVWIGAGALAAALAGGEPALAQRVWTVPGNETGAGSETLPGNAAPDVEAPVLVDDEGRGQAYWRQRVLEARKRVDEARAAVASAEAELRNTRQKKRPRGEALDALEQAKARLADAETELAALPEEARRAGAPPGWLRVDPEAG